jgi:hypothetical protein
LDRFGTTLWYWFRDHFVVPVSIFSDTPSAVTEWEAPLDRQGHPKPIA